MGARLSLLLFAIPHRPIPLLEQVETYCVDKANLFELLGWVLFDMYKSLDD